MMAKKQIILKFVPFFTVWLFCMDRADILKVFFMCAACVILQLQRGKIRKVPDKHYEAMDIKIITIGGFQTGKSCVIQRVNGEGYIEFLSPTVSCSL